MKRSNQEWLADLDGPGRDAALSDLRAILLRGLTGVFAGRIPGDWEATLEDFSQDAVIKVLDNLDSFRGDSLFITWAQKIAVRIAYTELRRARWKDVSIEDLQPENPGSDYTPSILADTGPDPEIRTEQQEMAALVRRLIRESLTERQRKALLAVAVKGMPMEEIASRLGTNRNAVYKLIYDARQNLKKGIQAEGISPLEVLAVFDQP